MNKKLLIPILLIIACLLAACSPEKAIIGTWKHQSTVFGVVTETTYVFNEDGTGTKTSLLTVEFTYTITGDVLTITTSTFGIESSDEYTCKFEGSKLTLTGNSETLTLEKVN